MHEKGNIMGKVFSSAPNGWRGRGWIPGTHRGTDFGFFNANPAESKRVVAIDTGVVVSVYNENGYNGGWGNHIIIDHGSGIYSTYSHFAPGTITVRVGQTVSGGTYLGQMGSTGRVTGDSQHTEIREGGSSPDRRVDPGPYFDGTKQIPDGTPTAVTGAQRTVRPNVGTEGFLNGRLQPNVSSDATQKLAGGVVGSFDGFIRGQQVTVNGVTSEIWYRGAFRGNYFAAAGFTSQATDGLTDLGSVSIPAQLQPWFDAPTGDGQVYYWQYKNALNGNADMSQILHGSHRVIENPGTGPVKIAAAGIGDVWVGTKRNPAKVTNR